LIEFYEVEATNDLTDVGQRKAFNSCSSFSQAKMVSLLHKGESTVQKAILKI